MTRVSPLADPGRRRFATTLGAVGIAGFAGCATTPREPAAIDLSTPQARLRAFVRMRGALDERLVIGFLTGRYHGVVDGDPTALFGVAASTFARYRARPDGGYLFASHEQAFFTDLDTGRVLAEWTNPFNGRRVKPPVTQSQPSWRVLAPDLTFHGTDPDPPGIVFDQRVLAPELQGRDVVFTEQVRFAGTRPGATRPFRYAEVVSARAAGDDLAEPSAARVATVTDYTSISSWRPWMEMGDHAGEMVGHGTGRYGARIDGMPGAWVAAVRQVRPELLDDPGAPLAAVWNR